MRLGMIRVTMPYEVTLTLVGGGRAPATDRTTSQRLFSLNSGLVQKLTSLKQGGNLEYGLNRAARLPPRNCFRNRSSALQNSLRTRDGW